ncbi:phage antirepressor N-terminal domain-containing protein [Chromobacterium vaccinii]|uniref:phage antirepressor N-terminal domain-containing protein n=1 Tax=Chromobacterium vaccinii TaxID=1108595 RepID=UPI001E3C22C5|nr:phage antirepressor N-terminal domain-containing protein [Chromobacterium vaccinii]MCD4483740.1 phage antirepressor N-terminal domain-containing protein [Chromobacterium vaccinii]
MQQLNFAPVPFHGATLYLMERNNEPYTPMKPIVEGMGLDWKAQHRRLTDSVERWGMVMMTIPSGGGGQEMMCMPLRKLAGWLMTIQTNRVKPEIRDRIVAYQNECDEALWQYWTTGMAIKPGISPPPPARDSFLEMLVKEFGKGNLAAAELLKSRYGLALDMEVQRKQNAWKRMTNKQKLEEYGKRFHPGEG